MGTWRQLAFEQFPELKSAIVPVETLVDLYCELSFIRPLCTKPDVPLDELEREFRLFKKPG